MRVWYWSQLVVAGLVLAVAFVFPLSAMMGLIGTPVFVICVVGSLVVNQILLANGPPRAVTSREKVVLGAEYAAIAASLAALSLEGGLLEVLSLWLVTVVLAIAATITVALASSRSRAAV